jgi:dGTPase
VNLAEAIAHAAHDLEDAILLGRIQREDWAALPCDEGWAGATGVRPETDGITAALFGRSAPARRRAIGALVNAFIVSIDVENRTDCEHPLLRHQAELIEGARLLLNPLLALVQQRMANTPEARQIAFRGREVLWSLHEALDADPAALLPLDALQAWRDAIDARERARVLCDHLAGMTETQALSLHQRLYGA